MSHSFGDLLSQHLHRKHGLSQAKLAEGILQDPSVIGRMCRGERLTGPQARERVLSIVGWLHEQGVLGTAAEANTLLDAAGMSALRTSEPAEFALLQRLRPPSRSNDRPSAPPAQRTNLPAPLTSFIGRGHELDEITRLIATHRLATLTGAGGVGKTRLVIEVGIRLLQGAGPDTFADGVWLVELSALAEPKLAAQTIAHLFRLSELPDRSALEVVEDYLADRRLLLILDNCEHLVDACAEIAERLSQRCWQLHILTTSREALRVPGEAVYSVPPLSLPDPAERVAERVLDSPAAKLFVERAGVMSPTLKDNWGDVASIAHICRQLDGIPLALELTAPLARVLSLSEIAGQLHDQMSFLRSQYRTAIPRHRTMQSALDWSYRLLTPSEQQLLARVAVFVGGWTLTAAQAVCTDDSADDLAARLRQLVTKSLVQVDGNDRQPRYRLLEPVRQFAHTQLVAHGESDEIRRRHARYFLSLAEQMEQARDTTEERRLLQRLEMERANVRAVNSWALEQKDAEFACRYNGLLFAFWIYCSSLTEARYWLESALALQTGASSLAALTAEALALDVAGYTMVLQGDHAGAQICFQRELNLNTTMGDQPGIATSLRGCGFTAMHRGDLAQAMQYTEQSLAVSQMAGDPRGIAWSRYDLGYLAFVRGDLNQAQVLLEEALRELREQGILFGAFRTLLALGHVMRDRDELVRARAFYQAGLRIQQTMHYVQPTDDALEGLASVAVMAGDAMRAACLFGTAYTHREAVGATRWHHLEARYIRDITRARSQLDSEAWRAAWDAGCAMSLEQAVEYALKE